MLDDMPLHNSFRITDRELATVLAALRYWQGSEMMLDHDTPDGLMAIATGIGRFVPLSVEEIDAFCEYLNE
jgi:hypothetical protein